MENLGLNNDISVGGRKFHIQTSYSESQKKIVSNVFRDGEVIDSKEVEVAEDAPVSETEALMKETHQELTTEMEVLYYIYEKVRTVRHATSANKLGLLFLQKKLTDEAIEQFELALEIDPDYADVYANFGKALLIEEAYDRALEILEDGVNRAPAFADIQNYLGLAYLRTGKYAQAIERLESALKLNPEYFGAQFHLAMAKIALSLNADDSSGEIAEKLQAESIEHLEISAESMTDQKISNFDKIQKLVTTQSYREAVDTFLQINPRDTLMDFMNVENEFYLKFMYGGKGKDDSFISEYVSELGELIDKNSDYADLRNNLGIAHLIQCRNLFLKSLDEFRTALRINPSFKKAEKNLKLAENDGKGFLILLRAILK